MKVFKRIYYPIMAVLAALLLVFSFVDSVHGGAPDNLGDDFYAGVKQHVANIADTSHNSYNPVEQDKVRNYIMDELSDLRTVIATKDDDGYDLADYGRNGDEFLPTVVLQETTMSEETLQSIERFEGKKIYADKEISNIVVMIPGKVTAGGGKGDVVMMTAHYDSRPEGPGATDNAVAAASMLENIKTIVSSDKSYDNDLLFVFTDAEEEGMLGAYTFKYQFKGFDNVYERVKLGTNFDALGNKGTLLMFQTSPNNSKLISEYSKIAKSSFSSSIADFVYGMMSNYTDFEIYGDTASLNFANVGGNENYHTAADSVANVKDSVIKQHSEMMYRVYNHFGDYNLNKLDAKSSSVFFSYLDIMLVHYPNLVSYIMGGIIIGLLAAVIGVVIKKKPFSLGKAGFGALVQILTIVATVIVLFISYYVVTLLLAGFGVFPIQAIGKLTYSSVGLIISVMLLTLAIASAFYIILRKAFNVKGSDVVRGNAFIWAILGLVLSFAMPSVGYFFAIGGILSLVVMLLTAIFKDKFKAKYSMDIERLFLYVVPMILIMPLVVPIIKIASTVLSLTYLPVIMALFVLMLGSIAPYVNALKKVFDKVLLKLPKRTIRVQREVTEKIEDKAKKGKFTEVTYKKTTNEKVEWRYLNRVGISVVAVVSIVMIMLFSSFGFSYPKTFTGGNSYVNSIYNDSLLFVWEKDSSGSETSSIEVYDIVASKYIRKAITDLEWDSARNAYTKEASAFKKDIIGKDPEITKTDNTYSFTPYDNASQVTLYLTNCQSVTNVEIVKNGETKMSFDASNKDALTVTLPIGYGSFQMKVTGGSSFGLEYVEHRMKAENSNFQNLREWKELKAKFQGDEKVEPYLRAGIVLKYKYS